MTFPALLLGCFACDHRASGSLPEREDVMHTEHWRVAVAFNSTLPGCVKTYLIQFPEAEGFSDLHVHVVPRMPDHPADARGLKVFAYLEDDPARWLPEAQRYAIALNLREALSAA